MNILFTCVGRRTYLLKYFKEQLKGEGLIVGTDMQLSAPALSVADIAEQVPSVYAENYVDVVLDICLKHNVKALICLNDLELPILSANEAQFALIGVVLIVSSQQIIDICFDKYKTAKYILSLGLRTPKTIVDYNEAVKAIKVGELSFPLVLKPRWGSGSIGIEFVDDLDEMEVVYNLLHKKVKKTILSTVSQGNDYILIQEKISGPEYGLDIINDLKGNNVAVSVKRNLQCVQEKLIRRLR